jgi:hypothetical protein
MSSMDVDGGGSMKEGNPVGIPVIFIEVREHDGIGQGALDADGLEEFAGAPG